MTVITKHLKINPILVIQSLDVFLTDLTKIFAGELFTWLPSLTTRTAVHSVITSILINIPSLVDGCEFLPVFFVLSEIELIKQPVSVRFESLQLDDC